MSVCVVNDYQLEASGDKEEAMAAARELVRDFQENHPGVQLSLWLEDRDDPLHHYHITIFDSEEVFESVRYSAGIDRFVARFYPHMDESTHRHPLCDVWLLGGHRVEEVG